MSAAICNYILHLGTYKSVTVIKLWAGQIDGCDCVEGDYKKELGN